MVLKTNGCILINLTKRNLTILLISTILTLGWRFRLRLYCTVHMCRDDDRQLLLRAVDTWKHVLHNKTDAYRKCCTCIIFRQTICLENLRTATMKRRTTSRCSFYVQSILICVTWNISRSSPFKNNVHILITYFLPPKKDFFLLLVTCCIIQL